MAQPAESREPANVVPISRAREVSQKSEVGPRSTTSTSSLRRTARFDALVRPLELAQGVRLNGTGLGWCLQYFAENREAFESCAGHALDLYRKGKSYEPLSLLCGMAKRREDYRLRAATAEELAELEAVKSSRQDREQPRRYGYGVRSDELEALAQRLEAEGR